MALNDIIQALILVMPPGMRQSVGRWRVRGPYAARCSGVTGGSRERWIAAGPVCSRIPCRTNGWPRFAQWPESPLCGSIRTPRIYR